MGGAGRPLNPAQPGPGQDSGHPVPPPPAAPGAHRVNDSDVPEDPHIHAMEVAVSWVLRVGVLLSVAIVLAGLALLFVHHSSYLRFTHGVRYETLTSPSTRFPHTFSGMVTSISKGQGRGVIVLGLVVLLATPVLRVAVGVVGFALERDLKMTLATAFVLLVLMFSIFFVGR